MHFNLKMDKSAGFTLIEVMVALVIFSVGALSLTYAMTQTTENQIQLENRTLAMWLARNSMTELRLREFPTPSDTTTNVDYAGRQWRVTTKIELIPIPVLGPLLRQATIDISAEDKPDTTIQSLRAVIGKNR